jgi:hypothetical protein
MGKASPERGSARAMIGRAVTSPADALPVVVFLFVTVLGAPVALLEPGGPRPAGNAT